MQKRFLVTNALIFIQNFYAEQLYRKKGELTVNGQTARVIETLNCDHYTQIGTPGSQESYLFDLEGVLYVVPESWAKEKVLRLSQFVNSSDFTFVEATNIGNLVVTATSDERPAT